MGLFSNLVSAISDGTVDKALNGAVDKLESSLDKVVDTAEKAADVVEQQGQKLEAATSEAEE